MGIVEGTSVETDWYRKNMRSFRDNGNLNVKYGPIAASTNQPNRRAVGQQFTTLNLHQVYLQFKLDEEVSRYNQRTSGIVPQYNYI